MCVVEVGAWLRARGGGGAGDGLEGDRGNQGDGEKCKESMIKEKEKKDRGMGEKVIKNGCVVETKMDPECCDVR